MPALSVAARRHLAIAPRSEPQPPRDGDGARRLLQNGRRRGGASGRKRV